MKPPEFPQDFVEKHCPRVGDARKERRRAMIASDPVEDRPEDDLMFAECEFVPRGFGMMCQNCGMHLTRPYTDHEVDREFLPKIEKYYADLDEWERRMGEIGGYI